MCAACEATRQRFSRDQFERMIDSENFVPLLCEVVDTTVASGRGNKCIAYARVGIPEYWILNLNTSSIQPPLCIPRKIVEPEFDGHQRFPCWSPFGVAVSLSKRRLIVKDKVCRTADVKRRVWIGCRLSMRTSRWSKQSSFRGFGC